MRKLTVLSLSALVATAAGYAAKRYLGAREGEWHTVGATPSLAARTPTTLPTAADQGMAPAPYDAAPARFVSPEPVDLGTQPADTENEPADLYDVEPDVPPAEAAEGGDEIEDNEIEEAEIEEAEVDEAGVDEIDQAGASEVNQVDDGAPTQTAPKPFDPLTDPLPPEQL